VELTGRSLIGSRAGKGSGQPFFAWNPANGERLQPGFISASAEEIDAAVRLAYEAFSTYRRTSGREKGAFLRKIAGNLESISAKVIERAELETALPTPRLQSEMARTCGQLRLFAEVIEEGSWTTARIDRADPNRKPLPKPDIRSMLQPLGPVAVFGASNFPLAFSVAGGDTASALAAGNAVVVKAHPAHPGTSELVGRALQNAVRESGLPEGVFSLLFDSGTEVGTAIVCHPLLRAAGFTGSRAAGRALMDIAASRPEPIPFFAEMSSTNPVFILPGALRDRRDAIATGLHASFTLGAGQFCTKPGLVFLPEGKNSAEFSEKLREASSGSANFHMLTAGIQSSYVSGLAHRRAHSQLKVLVEPQDSPQASGFCAQSALFSTDVRSFLKDPSLADEIFGPATLLVESTTADAAVEVARNLEGHLTATILGNDDDLRANAELISVLSTKVGRIIFNSFPTGVEVCHAMVHGGPYPATSDARFTSVGTQAIFRFARPVCYQSFPDHVLPAELQDANPHGIWRMVDGQMTREPLAARSAA
jgi:NADP-dependent aldehyde dehydrogenase